jgi:hypothetical protein
MLTVNVKEANIISIEINGDIDAETMESGLNRLLELCDDLEQVRLLYRITQFKMPSLAALGVKFKILPKLFKLLGKIDHAAVLTDEGWIAKAAEIEGAIIPGLEIRSFSMEEEEAAMSYLRTS